MVKHLIPNQDTRVRFPSSALFSLRRIHGEEFLHGRLHNNGWLEIMTEELEDFASEREGVITLTGETYLRENFSANWKVLLNGEYECRLKNGYMRIVQG